MSSNQTLFIHTPVNGSEMLFCSNSNFYYIYLWKSIPIGVSLKHFILELFFVEDWVFGSINVYISWDILANFLQCSDIDFEKWVLVWWCFWKSLVNFLLEFSNLSQLIHEISNSLFSRFFIFKNKDWVNNSIWRLSF